ncbi:putative activating transcription factor 2-like [Homarus americanus]|uniref:Putative activating transcription factor 2-like n=1 Tax=Homarus americanus TaxID=6706 RepID=A0A8J5J9E5_HOMAM|nr:putative activating transcription factor 2-like [Homarus americanus]
MTNRKEVQSRTAQVCQFLLHFEVTVMGAPEIITAEINPKTIMMTGTSNMIMGANGSPVTHTATLSRPQLLNLTLHHAPQSKSPSVLRKSY